MLTWALHTGKPAIVSGMVGFAGVGIGLRLMPEILHAVGLRLRLKARGLAMMSFSYNFGGTIGITIMGSVFSNNIASHIANEPTDIGLCITGLLSGLAN